VFRVGFRCVPGRVPVFRVGLRVLQIPIQARRANEICHVKTCHRKRTRLWLTGLHVTESASTFQSFCFKAEVYRQLNQVLNL
jgi:hypothetical protein